MAAPTTFNELVTSINATLNNFAQQVGEDVVSANIVDETDFAKATGTYINSPTAPWTSSTIPLLLSGAVRGGISCIWYKGAVLTKSSFTGGTITMFSGVNVSNELCRVFIDYDAGSGAFSVNIQTGYTGDLPTGGEDNIPPEQMEITSVDMSPATMEITSIT